jgi:hypothetical protein
LKIVGVVARGRRLSLPGIVAASTVPPSLLAASAAEIGFKSCKTGHHTVMVDTVLVIAHLIDAKLGDAHTIEDGVVHRFDLLLQVSEVVTRLNIYREDVL